MSLVNNTTFRIHQLRLAYLRDVDDIYGPRTIALDPAYAANPFIVAASLADADRWPQLNMPSSPQHSDDDHDDDEERPPRLKYTQTIMGNRSGGFGMRVHARRTSTHVQNFVAPNAPVQDVLSSSMPVSSSSALASPPEQGPAPFIPKFKGAAEMEKRRRARMAARQRPAAAPLSPDSSEDDASDFDADSLDDADEFDLQPTANSDSDVLSVISAASSDPTSPWPLRPRAASRLSPVSEDNPRPQPTPLPKVDALFAKKKFHPPKPLKSALSSLLASADASSNPFSENYAAVSGRGESASDDVIVYFPHATRPKGKPMELNVRKDATVEEVIGFSLWTYWSEGWLPRLDQGLSGESDPNWETKVSAVAWILRIAEDDGEPRIAWAKSTSSTPTRMPCWKPRLPKVPSPPSLSHTHRLTPKPAQQNQLLDSKIQRHPSRVTKKAEKLTLPTQSLGAPSSTTLALASTIGSLPLSTSLGPSSSHGPPIFLRIRVADTADTVHISTTIPVYVPAPRSFTPLPLTARPGSRQIRWDVHARSPRARVSQTKARESE
ncbi:hypothetical protein C0992_008166 [Termitomyces sp. T32_za158]|nr:hypothetical protein C0992_008166 [Termitomyces sp. T32_za158]